MKRAIIRFKDKTFINIPADAIDVRNELIYVWNGEDVVAIAKLDNLDVCYLSEKKEETENA
jgi:hypothetical protein